MKENKYLDERNTSFEDICQTEIKNYEPSNKERFNKYLEMGYNALKEGDSKRVGMFQEHAKSSLTELLKENFLREDASKTANENTIKRYYIKQFGKFCKAIDKRNGYENFPMGTVQRRPIEKNGKILHIYSKETLKQLYNLNDQASNLRKHFSQKQKDFLDLTPYEIKNLSLDEVNKSYELKKAITLQTKDLVDAINELYPRNKNSMPTENIIKIDACFAKKRGEHKKRNKKSIFKKIQNYLFENKLEAEPKNEELWGKIKSNAKKYLEFGINSNALERNLECLRPTIKNKFTLRPNPVDLKIARYIIN